MKLPHWRLWLSIGAWLLLLAGCANRPAESSGRPWNRPTKADLSTGWWHVGNHEQAEAWRKDPYP